MPALHRPAVGQTPAVLLWQLQPLVNKVGHFLPVAWDAVTQGVHGCVAERNGSWGRRRLRIVSAQLTALKFMGHRPKVDPLRIRPIPAVPDLVAPRALHGDYLLAVLPQWAGESCGLGGLTSGGSEGGQGLTSDGDS